ncbi:MAG: aminotransferase class I/II-fold pyridoxal phosphate-dependent enzyme, partial [Gammaproteobacteria bacterium]|nr:aminotransferase class I/II-fold pyridoxal phosphate-dependent enzyme [Gammaproteobacteria bacterium]
LGLAADPRVCAAFKAGVDRWGVGSGASHLVSGHTAAHQQLEVALADFTGRPRALLFGSGYAANVGALSALLGPRDQVFEDRLNHASLLDGGWLSRANFDWYAHADTADLASRLGAVQSERRKLIVSDGTFSMDGDLCPLDRLVDLARQHAAWLMIDDAHGFGVHGAQGCGVVDPARHDCSDV